MDTASMRNMESCLMKAVKFSKHPLSAFLTKLLPTYTMGASARDAIAKYKELGDDIGQRVKRDGTNTNLASVARHVVAFFKQCQLATRISEESKEALSEETPDLVRKCLDIQPGKAFSWLQTDVLADSVMYSCKEWAGKIKEVLGRIKGVSKGHEVGGEKDWKKDITDHESLEEVLKVAGGTLAKVEGNVLGERIGEMDHATRLRLRNNGQSLFLGFKILAVEGQPNL